MHFVRIKRACFWIKDFITRTGMWQDYKYVTNILNHPETTIEERRKELQAILEYAKQNTVFYSSIKGNRLSDFPVVSKKIINDNIEQFSVNNELIPGQKGELHLQKTSGSTGNPFRFYQDTLCRTRRIATIKAVNELVHFHSFEPLLHFRSFKHYYSWGDSVNMIWKKNLNILYADNSTLTPENLNKITTEIIRRKIKYIRGYLTSIDILTEYIVRNNVNIPQKITIFTGGETVRESVRSRVVDILHWDMVSQYANEENGVLGQAALNGPLDVFHLYLANCFVEILKIDSDEPAGKDELGRVVVTDYTNKAMPLIRYEIGDLAIAAATTTDHEVTAIKGLAGRETEYIYTTDGTRIDLFNSVSEEIYNNPIIYQWQFIQLDEKEYKLILCGDREVLNCKSEHYKDLLLNLLGNDAIISIEIVTAIPVKDSGKRKLVEQHYHPNH